MNFDKLKVGTWIRCVVDTVVINSIKITKGQLWCIQECPPDDSSCYLIALPVNDILVSVVAHEYEIEDNFELESDNRPDDVKDALDKVAEHLFSDYNHLYTLQSHKALTTEQKREMRKIVKALDSLNTKVEQLIVDLANFSKEIL